MFIFRQQTGIERILLLETDVQFQLSFSYLSIDY